MERNWTNNELILVNRLLNNGKIDDDIYYILSNHLQKSREQHIHINRELNGMNINQILFDLDMSQEVFNDIAILSGTDYNLNDQKSLSDTVRLYMKFRETRNKKTFCEWLMETTNYIENLDNLQRVRRLFDLNLFLETHREEFKKVVDSMPFQLREMDLDMLKNALVDDGFIFC